MLFRWLIAAIPLTVAAGCFGSATVPTKGTVKLDGKVLAGATVTFLSQETGGRDASGTTDASGVFRLTTNQPNDGAFAGKYKVIVQPPSPLTTGGAQSPEEAQRAATEGKSVAKEPAVVIAARFSVPGQTTLEQVVPAKGEIVLELQSK